jgi:hypothetical protein
MRGKYLFMGLAALAFLALGTQAMGLTLVRDGQAVSVIVVAKDGSLSANKAAQELQYHLQKMSGATVPIVTDDALPAEMPETQILIGPSAQIGAVGFTVPELAPEGFVIRALDNALVIVGDDNGDNGPAEQFFFGNVEQCGTYYGVIDLLQDQFGCQWIWPGEIGEYIPRRATVEVGDLNVVDEPALKRRHMRLVLRKMRNDTTNLLGNETLEKLKNDEMQWYRRMRMGRSAHPPRGHSFTDWWARYKDTNPEVFALLPNGQRGPSSARKPDYVKMCVANPAFWDLQLKEFKEMREQDPSRHDLSCCENDGKAGFCTCDLCKAWDVTINNLPREVINNLDAALVRELTPGGNDGLPECLSVRYAKWYNELARRVKEIDPEGVVTAYAYTRFREVPLGITLEPNMIVGYVGFNGYPRTLSQRAIDRRDYLGWAHPGVRMYIRPNAPHYAGNGHPFNVAREMAEDFQFCINHGTYMTDYDSMIGYWAAWGPTYYVLARQMWEGGDVDPEMLLDEWFNGFGSAERQVREYYDFWERYIISASFAMGARQRGVPETYTPEVMAEARRRLANAVEAAPEGDESIKAKLENIAMCLTNTELSVKAELLAREVGEDEAKKAELKAVMEELVAHRRKMAPRNVVNVYAMTRGEMGSGGYWKGSRLPWNLVADFEAGEGALLID